MTSQLSFAQKEKKKSFFTYWEQLDNFITMTEKQNELLNQEIRLAIIDILALGIKDEDPFTGEARNRRVLSAPELLEEINKRLDNEIKKSNLYFHLDKLEKGGMIKVVDSIAHGKRLTTFYGRTAKAFTPPDEDNYPRKKFGPLFDERLLAKLVTRIKPETTEVQIQEKLDTAFDNYFRKCSDDKISRWLDKYQEMALKLEIDMRRIYDMFDLLRRYDLKTIAAMQEIAELLDFPLDN